MSNSRKRKVVFNKFSFEVFNSDTFELENKKL